MINARKSRITQVEYFLSQAETDLCSKLETESTRFPSYKKLLSKFRGCVNAWKKEKTRPTNGITEITNELCLANLILSATNNPCLKLDYEPPLDQGNKSIDFRLSMENGRIIYCDVKTIHPKTINTWDKFEYIRNKNLFPNNTHLILKKDWLGGKLWHNMYAARSKMLEYSLELEDKISNCRSADHYAFVMAFCSNGFHWHLSELEDFADFYLNGRHNPGDPFADMENNHIREKNIHLSKNIDHFAYLERNTFQLSFAKFVPHASWYAKLVSASGEAKTAKD